MCSADSEVRKNMFLIPGVVLRVGFLHKHSDNGIYHLWRWYGDRILHRVHNLLHLGLERKRTLPILHSFSRICHFSFGVVSENIAQLQEIHECRWLKKKTPPPSSIRSLLLDISFRVHYHNLWLFLATQKEVGLTGTGGISYCHTRAADSDYIHWTYNDFVNSYYFSWL